MRMFISVVILTFCLIGYSESARAEEAVQVSPITAYLSGFGGYAFPMKTDVTVAGITSGRAELDKSPSFGGKIGIWLTGLRTVTGIDVGAEIDVTNFQPNLPGGQVTLNPIKLNATYAGLNVLARIPMGASTDLPEGRWFPYIGIGGGIQHLRAEFAGVTLTNTVPAIQGLGGVKIFLSKYLAVFAEGKFIHASHTFQSVSLAADLNTFQAVGGVALHIN